MITYGTCTTKPTATATTMSTPSTLSTQAAIRRAGLTRAGAGARPAPGAGAGAGGAGGSCGSSSATWPSARGVPDTVDDRGPAPGSDCHAAPADPCAAGVRCAHGPPRVGARPRDRARRGHRLPRGRSPRDHLRRTRHRHQRQAPVTGAGARPDVERAAAVAGLARGRPLDDAELALARTAVADEDERVRVAAFGALVRGAPRATA